MFRQTVQKSNSMASDVSWRPRFVHYCSKPNNTLKLAWHCTLNSKFTTKVHVGLTHSNISYIIHIYTCQTTTTITDMITLSYTSHTNLYNLYRLLPVQIHLYSNIGRTQQSCYKVENSCVGEWHIHWCLEVHEHTVIIWQLTIYIARQTFTC